MPRPVSNPKNPWSTTHVEWLEGAPPPDAKLEVFEEEAKSILSKNDSPDLPFRYSLNPYRGCYHGCAYCYARPTHQYLGFGAGTDFDRKIVVKTNAPELLRREFLRPAWSGDEVVFSGNTDCYQPLEASYELTRQCLSVCLEFKNPVAVITKGALVRRDIGLLAQLSQKARCHVALSIAFADDETSRRIEPYASPPSKRLETLRLLADAGVPVGVSLAPVIPGLNDGDIPELLGRARAAGATSAFLTLLRLNREVLPVFDERVRLALAPERVRRMEHALAELRGGKRSEGAFFARHVGAGERWKVIEQLFAAQCRRLGLNAEPEAGPPRSTFRRPPSSGAQGTLFDDL